MKHQPDPLADLMKRNLEASAADLQEDEAFVRGVERLILQQKKQRRWVYFLPLLTLLGTSVCVFLTLPVGQLLVEGIIRTVTTGSFDAATVLILLSLPASLLALSSLTSGIGSRAGD
jgi:hypothetical protein